MSLVPKKGLTYKELTEEEREAIENKERIDDLYDYVMRGGHNKGDSGLKYDSRFIKVMFEHMCVEGKSYKSLAFKLGVNPSALHKWEKTHAEWAEAKKIAFEGRLGKIEEMLTDLGTGKAKGNAAAAIFYAKNAAPEDFKDKREEVHTHQGTVYMIDTGIPAKKDPPQLPSNEPETIEADYKEIQNDEDDLL